VHPRTSAMPPASLDALAASLGGVPVPAAAAAEPWTPSNSSNSSNYPRFDHALALFLVPLALLGTPGGRETEHGRAVQVNPILTPGCPQVDPRLTPG